MLIEEQQVGSHRVRDLEIAEGDWLKRLGWLWWHKILNVVNWCEIKKLH